MVAVAPTLDRGKLARSEELTPNFELTFTQQF
jgi:hypothetical protein